jgi:hypothetical protein
MRYAMRQESLLLTEETFERLQRHIECQLDQDAKAVEREKLEARQRRKKEQFAQLSDEDQRKLERIGSKQLTARDAAVLFDLAPSQVTYIAAKLKLPPDGKKGKAYAWGRKKISTMLSRLRWLEQQQ